MQAISKKPPLTAATRAAWLLGFALVVTACSDGESTAPPAASGADTSSEDAMAPKMATAPETTPEEEPSKTSSMEATPDAPMAAPEPPQLGAAPTVEGKGMDSGSGPTQHVVTAQVTNFNPMILFVEPGDSVVWKNMAGHNVVSIEGMIPDGADAFASKLGEEGYSVKFDEPGAYVYKCVPHVSTGMVAAVVVGDGAPANMGAIDTALGDVKIARNMVNRAIRKMKKALDERGGG